jgi:hypothetical protein
MGVHTRTAVMQELFDHALTNNEAWPDQLIVDLLQGRWGSHTRVAAAMAIEEGQKEGGQVYSFVRFCIAHKRLALVGAVADLGLPTDLAAQRNYEHVSRATTDTGRWLDIMSNVEIRQTSSTSFAGQICAFSNSPTGSALADILARHDPNHGDIPTMTAAGSAVFTAALMRHRIEAAGTSAAEPATKATPARRRLGL